MSLHISATLVFIGKVDDVGIDLLILSTSRTIIIESKFYPKYSLGNHVEHAIKINYMALDNSLFICSLLAIRF